MKLDDGRLTFVAQQEVTALDAIHKAVLGKAACAGRVTEGVGTCISIHAPTWGATRSNEVSKAASSNFNPRTHVGCDGHGDFGARHNVISIHAPTWGATCGVEARARLPGISIHAPTWGATCAMELCNVLLHISIHAPTWGATAVTRLVYSIGQRFQSTHPRGVRP